MTQAAIDYNKLKSAPVHLDAYIKSIDSESKEGVVKSVDSLIQLVKTAVM